MRMIQCGDRAGFPLEPFPGIGAFGETGRKDLDRYRAIQPGIARTVDFPHSARAGNSLDFIGAEFLSRSERHWPGILTDLRLVHEIGEAKTLFSPGSPGLYGFNDGFDVTRNGRFLIPVWHLFLLRPLPDCNRGRHQRS